MAKKKDGHTQNVTSPPKKILKILVICAIIMLVALFYLFDLGQYFSLDYVKTSQDRFAMVYNAHPVMVIAAYMGIYIMMAALSLPGAAVMTLLGGALFGVVVGTIAISFASTLGATLACIVARFVLHDWVNRKVGKKLHVINAGIEKDGSWYLLTMRLIPVFPFWLINLAIGLTRMPVATFYWVSQVGMLPGTIVYVFAGTQLGRIESLSGILSPGVIVAFVILGLFPIVIKTIVKWYQTKRLSDKG